MRSCERKTCHAIFPTQLASSNLLTWIAIFFFSFLSFDGSFTRWFVWSPIIDIFFPISQVGWLGRFLLTIRLVSISPRLSNVSLQLQGKIFGENHLITNKVKWRLANETRHVFNTQHSTVVELKKSSKRQERKRRERPNKEYKCHLITKRNNSDLMWFAESQETWHEDHTKYGKVNWIEVHDLSRE